jgi:hypothetical protein
LLASYWNRSKIGRDVEKPERLAMPSAEKVVERSTSVRALGRTGRGRGDEFQVSGLVEDLVADISAKEEVQSVMPSARSRRMKMARAQKSSVFVGKIQLFGSIPVIAPRTVLHNSIKNP